MSTATTLSDRIRELLPAIAERAPETERLRRVPDQTIAELREAGYLRAFVPAKYGGLEVSPHELSQATRLLAGACTSTAWAVSLLAAHAHPLANFSPRLQDEVWGADPGALVCSSVAPMGVATPATGGIRLSGRYSWSSGCEHATWAIVGFRMPGAAGEPEPHFAVIPRGDYTIEDTWHVMGLRGTGSQDLVMDEVFVPDHRIESVIGLNIGTAKGFGTHPASLFTLPFMPVFSLGFAAVGLGAAEALLDLYRQRLSTRVRAYTGTRATQSTPALVRLAEATHEVRCAARLLEHDWERMRARAVSSEPVTWDDLVEWRGNQAYATRLCVRAVDRLFEASGGGAVRDESTMQRLWRDIHAGAAHAYSDYDTAAQTVGAHLAGVALPEGSF
ncbi:flavin-dependent monooxygenase [Actinocorallia sp. API 0066]|uniref:flavin-dependent monooxygenase n=1 Tax=Actinocorallia sp. API 0066 TaxID=2896846 RepID=UPI001E561799|nr:flavin-dependent monooxygenase [Actinocorallia sp. API 0066]MCD0447981.1 flavin-dependent monooxygenase [Actinocorallia sp. API 0066]